MCVIAGITQGSAINSTFGLHNGQKDRKFSFSLLWNIVFLTLEEGGSWESKDSGFLLGSWVGLGASRMKQAADGGSKCQHPAVQQAWRPFDSVAMLLACGRRYPLPRAHRWRRKRGKVLSPQLFRVRWRWRGGVGGLAFGRQVVVRIGARLPVFPSCVWSDNKIRTIETTYSTLPRAPFLAWRHVVLGGMNLSVSYLHYPDLVM